MTGTYTPGQGFVGDPRLGLARALMQQGASTAPVQSPLEGLARALSGVTGGMVAANAKQSAQKGMADAVAALGNQSIPADQRLSAATAAYAKANPYGDNPLEGMQMSALMKALLPAEPVKVSKGDRLVDPRTYKELVPASPDLPQGTRMNTAGGVEAIPGFADTMAGIKKAEAGGTAQGQADVKLVMEPKQLAAERPERVATAGGEAGARKTAEIKADLAPVQTATGPMAGAQAVSQAKEAGTQAAQGPSQAFNRENSLRDEFTKLTTDFRTVQDAHNKIKQAGQDVSPAGDLSLLYAYNKLLDPGSVVRESEFATAAATGSLGERMQAAVTKLASGERLTPEQRADFLNQADNIYKAQKRGYDNLVANYSGLAKSYNLDPAKITTAFEQGGGVEPRVAASAPPPPPPGTPDGALLTGPKGEQFILKGGKWVPTK